MPANNKLLVVGEPWSKNVPQIYPILMTILRMVYVNEEYNANIPDGLGFRITPYGTCKVENVPYLYGVLVQSSCCAFNRCTIVHDHSLGGSSEKRMERTVWSAMFSLGSVIALYPNTKVVWVGL